MTTTLAAGPCAENLGVPMDASGMVTGAGGRSTTATSLTHSACGDEGYLRAIAVCPILFGTGPRVA